MRLTIGRWHGVIAAAATVCLLTACGGIHYEVDVSELTGNWESHQSGKVTVYYPTASPRATRIKRFADGLETVRGEVTRLFQVDTNYAVDAFLFTTNEECIAATGRDAGFADGNHAFYRLGAPLGGPMTLAVVDAIDPGAQKFPPLVEGLRVAFDFTGRNYHRDALELKQTGRWVPLAQLLGDDAQTPESQRRVLRGSFVGYLISVHRMFRFHQIWKSVLPLDRTVEEILEGSLDQIDEHWQKWIETTGMEE